MQVVTADGTVMARTGAPGRVGNPVRVLLAVLAGLLAMTLPLRAASAEDSWQFIVEPYVYMGSLDGNASIGRAEGDINADFSDLLKNLKIAAMLNAEVTNDRWGIIGDVQYLKLGLKQDLRGDRFVELSSKMTIFETEAFYRWHLGERVTLDALAGIRYWNIRMYADLSGPFINPSARRAADWVDPIIGVRLLVPLTERLLFRLRGDIGGFGVGSSFSWQIFAGFVYDVSKSFALTLSYRYLDADYSRGTPDTPERFVFDAAMHGPQLGFKFTF